MLAANPTNDRHPPVLEHASSATGTAKTGALPGLPHYAGGRPVRPIATPTNPRGARTPIADWTRGFRAIMKISMTIYPSHGLCSARHRSP